MNSLASLILASSSPYRKELLERLHVPFTCVSPDIDEDQYKNQDLSPQELAETLAFEKAYAVLDKHPESIVIGGDQVLAFKNEIFGKPGTEEEAVEQLLKLKNDSHQLITSICILGPETRIDFTNIATMTMKDLSSEQIKSYVSKDQPLSCCGSYMLESLGISLFDSIDCDDHTAIIGIPLIQLTNELSSLGFSIP